MMQQVSPMSTLDRKLKKIAEEKAAQAGEQPGQIEEKTEESLPSGLLERAQSLLGDYLVKELFVDEAKNGLEAFLRTLGPFVLAVLPYKPYTGTYSSPPTKLSCTLISGMDRKTWNDILLTFEGEFLETTDLAAGGQAGSSSAGAASGPSAGRVDLANSGMKYIPQYHSAKALLCKEKDMRISPYLLAMGMAPEHRALVAVAIGIGIEKGDLKGWDDGRSAKVRILSCVPDLTHLAEAAGQYGITDLTPVIADLNNVVAKYAGAL